MQRTSFAPVLSATLSRDSCWITCTPVCLAGSHPVGEPCGTDGVFFLRRQLNQPPSQARRRLLRPLGHRRGGGLATPTRRVAYLAFSRISMTRQRLLADSGRVSIRRTRSPTPQALASSCALYLVVRRMT